MDQRWIDRAQARGLTKDDVSRILALANAPIIAFQVQSRLLLQERIDPAHQRVEKLLPRIGLQLVDQFLCPWEIVNLGEAVVVLLILDPGSIRLPCQILAAIETDLEGERKPGLQAHRQQAKLRI